LFQAIMPVHKDNHRIGARAFQKNLNGKPKGRQLLVPLANLLAGDFQGRMMEAENTSRFHPRQCGGALPDQHGLKRP
jgi:hypothetical protein